MSFVTRLSVAVDLVELLLRMLVVASKDVMTRIYCKYVLVLLFFDFLVICSIFSTFSSKDYFCKFSNIYIYVIFMYSLLVFSHYPGENTNPCRGMSNIIRTHYLFGKGFLMMWSSVFIYGGIM